MVELCPGLAQMLDHVAHQDTVECSRGPIVSEFLQIRVSCSVLLLMDVSAGGSALFNSDCFRSQFPGDSELETVAAPVIENALAAKRTDARFHHGKKSANLEFGSVVEYGWSIVSGGIVQQLISAR